MKNESQESFNFQETMLCYIPLYILEQHKRQSSKLSGKHLQ